MNPTAPTTRERCALLVYPQPLWLDTISDVVNEVGIRVVNKATSAAGGKAMLGSLTPDLLVTDLRFPGEGLAGLDLLRHAASLEAGIRSLVLCVNENEDQVEAAFKAGAAAYVHKRSHPDDVACAIRQLFDRSLHFTSDRPTHHPGAERSAQVHGLSPRELEVLRLVAEGHSNGQVARALWVTEQTVKFHLSNTFRKINVGNRTEASRWAQRNGVLDGELSPPEPAVV
jgi:DNA-binding NarL/FixJ family response regulator